MITDAPFPSEQPPDSGSPPSAACPRPARGHWRTAVRWARALVLVAVVAISLLGAVVTPLLGMLVIAPLLGAFLAGSLALVDTDFPRETSARRGVAYSAVAGVLLVPLANGLVGLGTLGGAIVLGLLVLAPLLVVDWGTSPASPATEAALMPLRELLPVLPTAQLLDEWRMTEDLLGSPSHHATAAGVRALLLDELSRRDPEGVAGWLAAGGPSPDLHIRADRGLPG